MEINKLVTYFQQNYPELVSEMKEANHHLTKKDKGQLLTKLGDISNLNIYHLESDVFTHTMMVCKVAQLLNFNEDVQIAALLHDIGKPICREITDKGRVSFFNHEPMSAFLSINILNDLKLSNERKRHIFELVALHTQAYKVKPEKLERLLTNNQKLAEDLMRLAECDHLGRFIDEDRCQHSFSPYELKTHSRASEEKSKEVVVMCGLPASGKSTYVRENYSDYFVACRDDLITASYPELTYNEAFKKVDQKEIDRLFNNLLKTCKMSDKVVIDKTHMSKKSRNRSLGMFGKDWKKTCVVLVPELEVIEERNKDREGKHIDGSVYERMIKSYYPPTYDVFDKIIYVWE